MFIQQILHKPELSKADIICLLNATGEDMELLFEHVAKIKQQNIGNTVHLRALVELSNSCEKDCYYCGIRKSNHNINRYTVNEDEMIEAIQFAYQNGYGSMAIQSGENQSKVFKEKINSILKKAKEISHGELGITLSCGEQPEKTYREWFENGAKRYLLRIETSNKALYEKLHPNNEKHSFKNRLNALYLLKNIGYQVGTGVMIGTPFQTVDDLADDLLFMKNFDIVMCGMGPYIEHRETPLNEYKGSLLSLNKRLELSLKMVAVLRILMPDINIAATTALQTIDKNARMKAIQIGANVLMPNITPKQYRDNYLLYENK
ncbi:MAG: Biotin synthase, partial [Bacteroidetes bacterium]|nr:Biotin synthase [Bacteroidota bacterium]